jgi:hypothetical protein
VRFGGSFSYSVPTTAGRTYLLRFTFSEVWWAVTGARLFDVRVNGATVLPAVDPYALAGSRQFVPAVQNATVTAPAGAGMNVSFVATRDNAILAAMEVSALLHLPQQQLHCSCLGQRRLNRTSSGRCCVALLCLP